MRALTAPAIPSAASTATMVTGTRQAAGGSRIATSGSSAPHGERHRRRGRGLDRAGQFFGVDVQLGVEVGGQRVVRGQLDGHLLGGRLGQALGLVQRGQLGELRASGSSASSRRSCASSAVSLSRWLDTDTYSPSAIDTAPATSPARPAVKIGPARAVAPATPTTIPATDTIPSLAPSTPARSQFSLPALAPACGSPGSAARTTSSSVLNA